MCWQASNKSKWKLPDLDTLLQQRDYSGAITLLSFSKPNGKSDPKPLEWLAYSHYHFGEHDKVIIIVFPRVHRCEF